MEEACRRPGALWGLQCPECTLEEEQGLWDRKRAYPDGPKDSSPPGERQGRSSSLKHRVQHGAPHLVLRVMFPSSGEGREDREGREKGGICAQHEMLPAEGHTVGGVPGQPGGQHESGGKESQERRNGKAGEWKVKRH